MTLRVKSYFDLRNCVPMARAEEHRCATEYLETRAPHLAARLVNANLRLVVKIAKGYDRNKGELGDLVQEGNLGLMHAVRKYDPARGVKLSSYAAWWIRAYILGYTIANWRLVKAGTTQAQRRLFFRMQGEQRKLESSGIKPDVRRLAVTLGVKEADVVIMLERFAGTETSLDAPRGTQQPDARTIGDTLSADADLRPDAQVEASEFRQTLHQKLRVFGRTLHGRDRTIYRQRLVSDEPATLTHLATGFGVTRERTRQLEQRLKGRIRDYLRQELGDAVEPGQMAA